MKYMIIEGFCFILLIFLLTRMCRPCTSAASFAHSGKMASAGVSVASLWTEVNRCGQNGDFTRALKALTKSMNFMPVIFILK